MNQLIAIAILTHSWYPPQCCGNNYECHRVPCEEITTAPNGDVSWHGMTISKYGAFNSQDAYCHACDYHERVLYCIFTPKAVS